MKYSELVNGIKDINDEIYSMLSTESKSVVSRFSLGFDNVSNSVYFIDGTFTLLFWDTQYEIKEQCSTDMNTNDIEKLTSLIIESKRVHKLKENAMGELVNIVKYIKEK